MTAPGWERKKTTKPQVKICGITVVEDALACASLGADAIGLVFYPKSPRYVDEKRAADICSATRTSVAKIGVFVDETYDAIMNKAAYCGLTGIQLHGNESPELAGQLRNAGLLVIKALFTNKTPGLDEAKNYSDLTFLVECAGGNLPGGNALCWDWGSVSAFGEKNRMILAGGLSPENVTQAVAAARPAGVDVSSGVESAPGRKDANKVSEFIIAVHSLSYTQNKGEIFR
jgi:phosphoribosylanthranilate isomerase